MSESTPRPERALSPQPAEPDERPEPVAPAEPAAAQPRPAPTPADVVPSIDEVGAPAQKPRRRGPRARSTELGFGLTAAAPAHADASDLRDDDLDEPLDDGPLDDDALFDDEPSEPPLHESPVAQLPAQRVAGASSAGAGALLAPMSALFYLIATREFQGATAVSAKRRENPGLYQACIWGDFAYRAAVIALAFVIVVLIAIKLFVPA